MTFRKRSGYGAMERIHAYTVRLAAVLVLSFPIGAIASEGLEVTTILEEARRSAVAIGIEGQRDYVLQDIAITQAEIGELQAAHQTLASIEKPSFRDRALLQIVKSQATAATPLGANKTTGQIRDGLLHATALKFVALAQACTGQFEKALGTAATIGGETAPYLDAYSEISIIQGQAGDWHGALATVLKVAADNPYAVGELIKRRVLAGDLTGSRSDIATILDPGIKPYALLGIVKAQLKLKDLPGALQTAGAIFPGHARTEAFLSIAKQQVKSGNHLIAKGNLQKALAASKHVKNSVTKADLLWRIVELQAAIGDHQGALQVAMGIKSPYHRARALGSITVQQMRWGDVGAAFKTISLVDNRNVKLINLGAASVEAGKVSDTKSMAKKFLSLRERDFVFEGIGVAQAEHGDVKGATETVRLIQNSEAQARIFHAISVKQATEGDVSAALKTVDMIILPYKREAAITDIAMILIQIKHFVHARNLVSQMTDEVGKVTALGQIAETQARVGNTQATLLWVRKLSCPKERAYALMGIAKGLHSSAPQSTDRRCQITPPYSKN